MPANHVDEALGGAHQATDPAVRMLRALGQAANEVAAERAKDKPRFHALDNYVAIRPEPTVIKTRGGIILPDDNAPPPVIGVVVHVGPGKWHTHGALVPVNVSPGQRVRYGEWVAGQPLEDIDGEKLLLIRETDIVGKWA